MSSVGETRNSPAPLHLQPLRIPSGWMVGWNTLYVTSNATNGDFGGSSLFQATNEARRFFIDVDFRPEFDPGGTFHLKVIYQPWPRTDRGRRRTDAAFRLDADAEDVHYSQTSVYSELVERLEYWIGHCTSWHREGH